MATEELFSSQSAPCTLVRPLLSAYSDGEASAQESSLIETHLALCESCASHLAFVRLLTKALPTPPVAALPPGLSARIAAGTYARPSFWERFVSALRPAPARYALGGVLATALVCAVVLPRLPQTEVAITNVPAPVPTPLVEVPKGQPAPAVVNPSKGEAPQPHTAIVVATARGTKKVPVVVTPTPAPLLSTPTDHRTEKVVVVPASATPAPTHLTEREAPKVASATVAAPNNNFIAGPNETLSAPTPVRTAALGGRLHGAAAAGLVEQGGDDLDEGNVKVALSVTSKQMKDAVGKISSLSANTSEHQTTGNRLMIADAPATIR